MSQNENNTLFYGYSAVTTGIASAASYLTGPMLAATTLMQNLFSFSPLALQLASYSAAPLFVATLAYAAYNFFSSSYHEPLEDMNVDSSVDELATPRKEASIEDLANALQDLNNLDQIERAEKNANSTESNEKKSEEEYSYHPKDLAKGAMTRAQNAAASFKRNISGHLSPRA